MQLKDKIKFAMDEARMLILGAQVLIGFGFQSVLQPGFARLPVNSQRIQMGSLLGLIVALALVLAPAARDCLVERGRATVSLHRYATRLIGLGLLPFATGLGASVYVATRMVSSQGLAGACGIVACFLAITLWYGSPLVCAVSRPAESPQEETEVELKDKIEHALTEARMALPGVQAMAGFQFIGMLTDAFARLPSTSKEVHVVSLMLSAITIAFLITPAAFHRIAENGEATERQHRITTRFLLAAMTTLPLAISSDLYVVMRLASGLLPLAISVSGAALVLFYALWFGPGMFIRLKGETR